METIILTLLVCILWLLSRDRNLLLENLALRQQLAIMKQKNKRPKIRLRDPTARWTAQQIVESCPWETLPKYLLRDRDAIYGEYFQSRIQNMGIHEVNAAPKSPWLNPYVERLIGSIRRDCLDHTIVLNEGHLKRILTRYFAYYHKDRTHLGLGKETPAGRAVSKKPDKGKVIAFPRLSGLHHRYEWQDAA